LSRSSSLIDLVRELDGHVRMALICVDERGLIRAAALPADAPRPLGELESRALESVFADVGGTVDASRERLATLGRARVRLALASGGACQPMDADLLRVDKTALAIDEPGELTNTIRKIAHDIHNPLASLRGFARLLRRDFWTLLDDVGRGYVDHLEANVQKVQGLIQFLVGHCEIPHRETHREAVSMHMVFAKLSAEIKPTAESRGVRLRTERDPAPIYANPHRLQQVALYLAESALLHMGEVEAPEVDVWVERGVEANALAVADNGVGLPPLERAELLELFRSGGSLADWRCRDLGLSIVKRILDAHEGRLTLETRDNGGVVLRAWFPNPPSD
jgi:signal transduction histidine kinase